MSNVTIGGRTFNAKNSGVKLAGIEEGEVYFASNRGSGNASATLRTIYSSNIVLPAASATRIFVTSLAFSAVVIRGAQQWDVTEYSNLLFGYPYAINNEANSVLNAYFSGRNPSLNFVSPLQIQNLASGIVFQIYVNANQAAAYAFVAGDTITFTFNMQFKIGKV